MIFHFRKTQTETGFVEQTDRKRGAGRNKKIECRIASSCLHDHQDLCWGNTSRDTSEEPEESPKKRTSRTEAERKIR